MRVLIAPDAFAGTLGAVEAAEAIAAGWRRVAAGDVLDRAPMSDGGPGFVDVLQAASGGVVAEAAVTGPLGRRVPAGVLCKGSVAFIEAAQACGLHHIPKGQRDATVTTTYGVGELLSLAMQQGAERCVLGLGGSATNDGGAGMLAALGARPGESLSRGGRALREATWVDLAPARRRAKGCELVAATDVDSPLLGAEGASAVFGPQKGANREQVLALEDALDHWANLTGREYAQQPGAGAAGGLGYGLLLLGGRRESGIDAVLRAVRLPERLAAADLVLTGEGSFDSQSLRGKVVSGVARMASAYGVPCLVLAGKVAVGRPEMAGTGVEAAYSLSDSAGSVTAAMAHPVRELALLAQHTARMWSHRAGRAP